jgi:hypothetical protein
VFGGGSTKRCREASSDDQGELEGCTISLEELRQKLAASYT